MTGVIVTPPLASAPGARYQAAMRRVERPALLVLAAAIAFALIGAATLVWWLKDAGA
ncbi:hypothetical protein [Marinicauda salina]|uniref:hypothetical protein n=1 Tax=Marinicauda salina TaxID=2135793 RepID=UPI001304A69E|nr:hypothetical protein [Marinicauda salina]